MIFSFVEVLASTHDFKACPTAAEGCRHSLLFVILGEDVPKRRASESKDLQLI